MPRWLPAIRRRPAVSGELVAALEETFGKDAVKVLKQSEATTLGGLMALIRVGKRSLPRRGQVKLLQAYGEMPWVRAVVGKISQSMAATEWIALRSKSSSPGERAAAARFYSKASYQRRVRLRKQMELVELPGHVMLDVMEEGNEFHTGSTIDELTQIHIELVGEAFQLKERNGLGRPTKLWSIPPSWIVNTPHPGADELQFVVRVDGVETKIPMSEMIWYKTADPYAPYGRGVGIGRSLGDELDTDEYAAKHMKAWFLNNAIPDLLVSADGLQPSDTERLEEDWLNKNQGFWNRFKPYFVGKKLKVDRLTASFQDMQLGQLRKDQRDVIIHTWGVAPEMFGITEDSNRANITGAFYQYARWVLVPRLEMRRIFLQTRLAPDFDPGLIIDYVSPVEEDKEHIREVMKTAPWAFMVDEWREEAGKGELPDGKGKVFGKPFSLVFSDDFKSDYSSEETPAAGSASARTRSCPVCGSGSIEREPDNPDWAAKLTEVEEQIVGQVLESIESGVIDDAVRPVLEETVLGFGASTMESILPGVAFDESDPAVVEFLKNGRKAEIKEANATTQRAIRRAMAEGYEAGEGIAQLQKRIEGEFADAIGRRSHVIARTESVASSNYGSFQAIQQSNVGYKGWLAVRDDVTRDGHLALDSAPPIPVTQNFVSPATGASAPHPGAFGVPEEDIQCRCAVTAEQAPKSGEEPATHLDTEEKRAAAWRSFESDRLPYQNAMAAALREAFAVQEKAAVAALREAS